MSLRQQHCQKVVRMLQIPLKYHGSKDHTVELEVIEVIDSNVDTNSLLFVITVTRCMHKYNKNGGGSQEDALTFECVVNVKS